MKMVYEMVSSCNRVAFLDAANDEWNLARKAAIVRKKYYDFFGKRRHLKSFKHDYFYPAVEGSENYLVYGRAYDWEEACVIMAAWREEKEVGLFPTTDRPFAPQPRDFVLLLVDGRLTEDFTFVQQLVREEDDAYVVRDMYGKELRVEPMPERDNGNRKAWKQVA